MKTIRENKGKSLLTAGIVVMWVFLLVAFKYHGYEETWQWWGIPTEMPPFKDFRLILGQVRDRFRNGFEPFDNQPGVTLTEGSSIIRRSGGCSFIRTSHRTIRFGYPFL
ncbi:MAG: hypothetical protein M0C28_36870 [Candidatus Moduliflexus flocculans]|nr:hypothetical protein [Candidatus Moduliflexus flocculans]